MPGNLLNDDIRKQLNDLFANQLVHPVELIYFYDDVSCETCEDTHQLLTEVCGISDKLQLNAYKMSQHQDLAKLYNISRVPGLVITGGNGDASTKYNLRFAGIPAGYEFSSLVQGIILVSKRDSGLKQHIREQLKKLTNPVNLKVFVTPT